MAYEHERQRGTNAERSQHAVDLGELPALAGQRGDYPRRGANARSPDEPKQEPHGKLSGQTVEAESGNEPVAERAQGR